MKKQIYILIVGIAFWACTGKKGEVGPQGDVGDKGPTGAAGQVGAKGPTGDQGKTGSAGIIGEVGSKGATPSANVYYSDWVDFDVWGKLSSEPVFYNSYKANKTSVLSIIPNPDKLTLTTFSTLGSYSVYHDNSKEITGTLFIFYSLISPSTKEQVIFNKDYQDGTFAASSSSFSGLWDIDTNLKTTPKIAQTLYVDFAKSKYSSTEDFLSILQNMKGKTRYIYIPIGMPAKNGRKISELKTYDDIINAYNIPR